MTVSTTSNKIIYSGNAATTVWTFDFPAIESSNLAVYYTDTTGVETLLSASDYTVILNPAEGSNPTQSGGSVTYPLVGSPIALGTFLTIIATFADIQDTSLANQGTVYPRVMEEALDYLTLLNQQTQEQVDRSIIVAVSDPVPEPLPAVAERAGLYMAFDSDGNPIAVAGTSDTSPISSAMAPVVAAATLALGRTALGLGNIATETIGAGLQDSGGTLRVNGGIATDSGATNVVVAFHLTERHATVALTYTCPLSSTLFSGFGFYAYALSGAITFAVNAADAFSGNGTGTSLIVPVGSQVWVSTDAAGSWFIRDVSPLGFNATVNLQLNATVAGNALTIAVKDRNGNDPSVSSPVLTNFRDSTVTGGGPTIVPITSALSIVIPNTALVGTVSAVAGRLWVLEFNNGGTPILAVFNATDGTIIYPLDEATVQSTTAISTAADSAGAFYGASAVTNKAFRILGYVEFTQATAGTWVTVPSKIQLFGPGIRKPGDTIQNVRSISSAVATGTTTMPIDNSIPQSTEGDQYFSQAFTPTSACNICEISWLLYLANSATNTQGVALFQDAGTDAISAVSQTIPSTNFRAMISGLFSKVINTAIAVTFKIRSGGGGAGTTTFNGSGGVRDFGGVANSYLQIKEYMS